MKTAEIRQLVLVLHRTGQTFGLVLNTHPMEAAQESRHVYGGGLRRLIDAATAACEMAAMFQSDVTVAEIVHRPGHVRHAGRQTRRYPQRTHYRVVATAAHESEAAAAA